ncbi:MAG: IS1182 family transposase [Chloroflexi bacterium]|nr:IS1182 family transposase [Chloroflexota bacterium]
MHYQEGVAREQAILFPETLDDYISDGNPVQFIDAFVDSLDLGLLGFRRAELEETGRPPYHPGDLLKLYIWGYLNRVRSSRCLEKESQRNVEVMWLIKKLTPDFKTIADFRKDNREALRKVYKEFTLVCKGLGLFGGELISIDGSKFRAVNCKKRNFNRAKLMKRIKEIEEEIERYLQELEENDAKEATVNGVSAEELKAKIEWLHKQGKQYRELLRRLIDSGESQISLTDPDSRAMLNNQRVEVCYNVQATVDSKHKLILDYEVSNEGTDYSHLSEMAQRAKEILRVEKLEALADKGYYSGEGVKECVEMGVIPFIPEPEREAPPGGVPQPEFYENKFQYDREGDKYICPCGCELTFRRDSTQNGKVMKIYQGQECWCCEMKAKCTNNLNGRIISRWEHEEVLEAMRARVKANRQKVRMRQWLSEHSFGTIKRGFNQGYMLLKGLSKVRGETGLTFLAYNIKRAVNILGVEALLAAVRKGSCRLGCGHPLPSVLETSASGCIS